MIARRGPLAGLRGALGKRIAPPRFVMFTGLMAGLTLGWHTVWLDTWSDALVIAFDVAAFVFAMSLIPLARDHTAEQMSIHSAQNDANRGVVLALTSLTALTILAAIVGELPSAQKGDIVSIVKLVGTLGTTWVFTNLVFMLHYAHMHYTANKEFGGVFEGFEFPGTKDPDYWDFLYFSFTAGMSFAASDVNVTRGAVRRVLVLQCLLSFVFNIGVLAFSINVLAGAAS